MELLLSNAQDLVPSKEGERYFIAKTFTTIWRLLFTNYFDMHGRY